MAVTESSTPLSKQMNANLNKITVITVQLYHVCPFWNIMSWIKRTAMLVSRAQNVFELGYLKPQFSTDHGKPLLKKKGGSKGTYDRICSSAIQKGKRKSKVQLCIPKPYWMCLKYFLNCNQWPSHHVAKGISEGLIDWDKLDAEQTTAWRVETT